MHVSGNDFSHEIAFARNLGLVSDSEQTTLRKARVALPGQGGAGGAHLLALARMGIGSFHLADPGAFEVVNFNRQIGATTATIGRNKAEVMAEILLTINPAATVESLSTGISPQNIDRFLRGVDVVVDGIEFFCIDARRLLYRECRSRKIPVVCAGPVGYGSALLVFMPETMAFDEFFGIDDAMSRAEQLLAFGLSLGPGMVGDMDPSRIDFEAESGPALGSACLLCAALAATEVMKLITGRGKVAVAPHGLYFDPYRGHVTPLQRAPSFHSQDGRQLRDHCFERFPALQAMHERELRLFR